MSDWICDKCLGLGKVPVIFEIPSSKTYSLTKCPKCEGTGKTSLHSKHTEAEK